MWNTIHIIANPASGTESPILFPLNRVLKKAGISWDLSVTQQKGDAFLSTQNAISRVVDAVAVYGGDGTVMEVAQALAGSSIPLVVLPGGSANVFAKEIGLPLELTESVQIFTRTPTIRAVDLGVCNDHPFLIRLNMGFLATIVQKTSRKQKNQLGSLAYALSMIESVAEQPAVSTYTISTPEETHTTTGIGLMVANTGNIGIPGVSLLPDMRIDDGLLDVYVLEKTDLAFLLSLTSSALNQRIVPESLKHWQVTEASISCDPLQPMILDDVGIQPSTVQISVRPKSVLIAT